MAMSLLRPGRRIAFGNWLTRGLSLARFGRDRFYPLAFETPTGEAALDQFIACWEGLEDPRTGNAALHDFHELLMIALCAVLSGGQGAVDMAVFAKAKEPFLRGFLKLANGLPAMIRSAGYSASSIRRGSALRFSGSWRAFARRLRVLSPSMARFCDARLIAPAASRRCTWSVRGAVSNAWCWRRSPLTPSPTRSPPCRSCSIYSH